MPHVDCGATPTLDWDGLGAITLKAQDGSDLSAGDLKSGSPYSFRKVGGNFFLDSSGGLSKFFGDGSDGALVTTANLTLDSTLNGPAVIKQYSSINIAAGHTLTVSNPCQGLILYSQGDVTISGTIDMSKKAGEHGGGNITPLLINKYKFDGTTKALEKFLQLTTALQAVTGGTGGNGGYGGGKKADATYRQTNVGIGGTGRINLLEVFLVSCQCVPLSKRLTNKVLPLKDNTQKLLDLKLVS